MLTGQNGILTRAQDAKTNTEIAEEKEAIGLAYNGVMAENRGNGVSSGQLQTELVSNGYNAKVTDNGDGTLNVFFEDSKNNYNVNDGTITKVEPLVAGLYDSNRNQIVSWDDLVNNYGLDISKNYSSSNLPTGYWKNPSSLYYILKNNSELSGGIILVVDDSIETIGQYALTTSQLISIQLPDNITSIGARAFSNCKSLTNITIPDNITSIGASAFSNCTSLTNITIPDSVTTIEEYVFSNCTSLTNITIPDSVL